MGVRNFASEQKFSGSINCLGDCITGFSGGKWEVGEQECEQYAKAYMCKNAETGGEQLQVPARRREED